MRSNHRFSDVTFQVTVIIPNKKGTTERIRRIENRISTKATFKSTRSRGVLMKSAQYKEEFINSVP